MSVKLDGLKAASADRINAFGLAHGETTGGAVSNGEPGDQLQRSGPADSPRTGSPGQAGTFPYPSMPDGWSPLVWPPNWLADAVTRARQDAEKRSLLELEIERRTSFLRHRLQEIDAFFAERKIDRLELDEDNLEAAMRRCGSSPWVAEAASITTIAALVAGPNSPSQQFRQNVAYWGRDRVLSADGSVVRFDVNGMSSSRATPAAAVLVLEEAKARGWKEIQVAGPRAFRRLVIETARKMDYDLAIHDKALLLPAGGRKGRKLVPSSPRFTNGDVDAPAAPGDPAGSRTGQPAPGIG